MTTIVRNGFTQSYKGVTIPTMETVSKKSMPVRESFIAGSPFGSFTHKKKAKKKS